MKIQLLNPMRTSTSSGPYGAWEDGRYFCASLQWDEMVQRSGLAEVAFPFLVQFLGRPHFLGTQTNLANHSLWGWGKWSGQLSLSHAWHLYLTVFPSILSSTALGFYWLSFSSISPLPSLLPSLMSGCPQELSWVRFREQISDGLHFWRAVMTYTYCCLLIIVFF